MSEKPYKQDEANTKEKMDKDPEKETKRSRQRTSSLTVDSKQVKVSTITPVHWPGCGGVRRLPQSCEEYGYGEEQFHNSQEAELLHTVHTLVNKIASHSAQDGMHNNIFSVAVIRKQIKQPNYPSVSDLEPSSYTSRWKALWWKIEMK